MKIPTKQAESCPNSTNAFYYPHAPIRDLTTLAKALGVDERLMLRVAAKSTELYRSVELVKADGTPRHAFDANPQLKAIQVRVKQRLLQKVRYPTYLMGGLPTRSTRKNAELHKSARIIITEDIEDFFPSISQDIVHGIWCGVFRFTPPVAEVLTLLTTKGGCVPQGAVTSSYLANLALWNCEPGIVQRLQQEGYIYSRFVDDIAISSKEFRSRFERGRVISMVYGMLFSVGLKPKRNKHKTYTSGGNMEITKLATNRTVGLRKDVRILARKDVFELERQIAFGEHDGELRKRYASVASKVGRVNSFHPIEGAKLKARLKAAAAHIEKTRVTHEIAPDDRGQKGRVDSNDPPWD